MADDVVWWFYPETKRNYMCVKKIKQRKNESKNEREKLFLVSLETNEYRYIDELFLKIFSALFFN